MKFSTLLQAVAAAAMFESAVAWPGMKTLMGDLNTKMRMRREDGDENDSDEMIGDLISPGPTSAVGISVSKIIVGDEDGFDDGLPPTKFPLVTSKACRKDTCCVWHYIARDLKKKFTGGSNRCNRWARMAVRQGFHDAGAWSKTASHGGADGSLILAAADEMGRIENKGLEEVGNFTLSFYNRYKKFGIGMADLIQFMANVATVTCPLGPRIRTYVGRPDSSTPAVHGLMPDALEGADELIELFEDKTIKSNDLAALVGAHTTAQQFFVDTAFSGRALDTTPGVWDTAFYNQTGPNITAPAKVFQFQSDLNLAAHPQIAAQWEDFHNQTEWNEYFSRSYVRLSLLGVNNINSLTECTSVLPARKLTA